MTHCHINLGRCSLEASYTLPVHCCKLLQWLVDYSTADVGLSGSKRNPFLNKSFDPVVFFREFLFSHLELLFKDYFALKTRARVNLFYQKPLFWLCHLSKAATKKLLLNLFILYFLKYLNMTVLYNIYVDSIWNYIVFPDQQEPFYLQHLSETFCNIKFVSSLVISLSGKPWFCIQIHLALAFPAGCLALKADLLVCQQKKLLWPINTLHFGLFLTPAFP